MIPNIDEETMAKMNTWMETETPKTPPWDAFFGPPRYARPTITERVEPYATQYDELRWQHPDFGAEYGAPDSEFYRPTRKLLRLEARIDALHAKAFREAPNPDYDEALAAEWRANRTKRFTQTTHYMGQSYNPDLHGGDE